MKTRKRRGKADEENDEGDWTGRLNEGHTGTLHENTEGEASRDEYVHVVAVTYSN